MTGCAAWSRRTRSSERRSLAGTFRLPPLAGAVLLKARRAAAFEREHPHPSDPEPAPAAPERGVTAQPPTAGQTQAPTSSSLADALLIIAEAFLAEKAAAADDPDLYQVIVHVGTDTVAPDAPPAQAGDVSAETRGSSPGVPGDPADPARCHVEDGPAISVTTAQMIACSSTWSWMLHDSAGKLLDLGFWPTASAERGAAPRGPRPGHVAVPVPRLRVPPD